jgi:hypothetical protein
LRTSSPLVIQAQAGIQLFAFRVIDKRQSQKLNSSLRLNDGRKATVSRISNNKKGAAAPSRASSADSFQSGKVRVDMYHAACAAIRASN